MCPCTGLDYGTLLGTKPSAQVLADFNLEGSSMWGLNWGELIWGGASAVPLFGPAGLAALIVSYGLGGYFMATRMRGRLAAGTIGLVLLLGPLVGVAAISLPYVFGNGEVADASEVNANFTALETGVNDNASDLACPDTAAEATAGFCVFNAGGGYIHNFQSAAAACEVQGARLCSLAESSAAQAAGLGICAWQWVADRSIADPTKGHVVIFNQSPVGGGCIGEWVAMEADLTEQWSAVCCKP